MNGLLYKDARKQLKRFNNFTKLNKVIPLTVRSAKKSAELFADLRKKGKEIGHTDTIIASIAITNKLQLITNNTNHFNRIKGLEIDNWIK
jgi:tRNA(fMet)-specific endonuclease VapC